MALRTLDPRTSILTLLTHPAYSSCRLQAHPLGAPHAQVFQDRSSEGMQVLTQEITLTNGLLAAQAQVSAAGAQLVAQQERRRPRTRPPRRSSRA